MTQKELENIIPLRNEIRELSEEIKQAELIHTSVRGSSPEYPHLLGNRTVQGYTDDILQDKARLHECKEELKRLEDYVNNIPDKAIQQLMVQKYFKGKTWQQIAFMIGKRDEGTPRKKVETFLENSENSEKQAV